MNANINAQEVFNTVAKHLLKQNKRSVLSEAQRKKHVLSAVNELICAYRSDDGCKCAVGSLIPDEAYDEKMENKTAAMMISEFRDRVPELHKFSYQSLGMFGETPLDGDVLLHRLQTGIFVWNS